MSSPSSSMTIDPALLSSSPQCCRSFTEKNKPDQVLQIDAASLSATPSTISSPSFTNTNNPSPQHSYKKSTFENPNYKLGQEVHLLDTSRNEVTGLSTYIVISNDERDTTTDETIYRVKPSLKTSFRVSESRILDVGYSLGTEVKQNEKSTPAIIIRRFVRNGQRTYDLKDSNGQEVLNVQEQELVFNQGGKFDFVQKSN